MNISLRVKLDEPNDALVIELEPGHASRTKVIKLDGSDRPLTANLDSDGYVLSVSVPGLGELLALMAGEAEPAPQKPAGKPGKPHRG